MASTNGAKIKAGQRAQRARDEGAAGVQKELTKTTA